MSKVEFTEAFETRTRIRAIEILVGALIAELPDIGAFRARVDTDLDAAANALNDVARALGEASRPDALHVSDGFTASVKEHMDAVMNGRLDHN